MGRLFYVTTTQYILKVGRLMIFNQRCTIKDGGLVLEQLGVRNLYIISLFRFTTISCNLDSKCFKSSYFQSFPSCSGICVHFSL